MAKKKKAAHRHASPISQDKPATLKDMLRPGVLEELKAQAAQLKAEEETRREQRRKEAEEARIAEQKRLENDFEYLLKNSDLDWKKYK
ncbi:YqkE family protein [Marinicrinis lubricantis]|uniref:YqkE family protein n=1 Tax=Marinicrinis lubricantis TaxID=2086470 RepID=A0ABW1IN79_9BACL